MIERLVAFGARANPHPDTVNNSEKRPWVHYLLYMGLKSFS